MRQKKLKLSAVLLLGLGLAGLQAQESLNASGCNASGSGGSVSYSVGQVVYTTNTGTNGSESQGVQQPYEISIVTAIIEQSDGIILNCKVYPNPTTDYLILEFEESVNTQYIASLFDVNGKLIESIKVEDIKTRLTISTLSSGIYFLKIMDESIVIKTFKIIKNKKI